MDTRYNERIGEQHCAVPWLVIHASSVITRMRKDDEGFTAYRKWKGRPFNRPVAEFGKCVWYVPALTVGRDKFDVRWREGVWLGIRMESGENIIGTSDGVVKARDFRRKVVLKDRWDKEVFDKMCVVPWKPVPGESNDIELKCKIQLPMLEEEITKSIQAREEYMPRRFRIRKEDVERYGSTIGCPGCRAVTRGLVAVGHTEACRKRMSE